MKRVIIVLAMTSGLCRGVHAEDYRWTPSQGSSHGAATSAAALPQSRDQGARREETAAHDQALRTAREKERKRAIAIIEEALKKARERARREAEEARKKRLAEEKQHPGPEKDAAQKQGGGVDSRTAAREMSPERSIAMPHAD